MIRLIGFDLDNTLYDHKQYVEQAYFDISRFVENKREVVFNKYFEWILNRWYEKGSAYNKIFEESYEHFNINGFLDDISEILNIYHSAEPKLFTFEGVDCVLEELSKSYKLVLITDGNTRTQNYKIDALLIRRYFEKIYISGDYGKEAYKPSTYMLEKCVNENSIDTNEMVYLGDNPEKDFEPCEKLGINFIRILKGEYAHLIVEGVKSIDKIDEIPFIIKELF